MVKNRPALTSVLYMTQRRMEVLRVFLDAGEESVSASDIVEKVGTNYASTCHILRRLHQHGWTVHTTGPSGRLVHTLTPFGRETAKNILHTWEHS